MPFMLLCLLEADRMVQARFLMLVHSSNMSQHCVRFVLLRCASCCSSCIIQGLVTPSQAKRERLMLRCRK